MLATEPAPVNAPAAVMTTIGDIARRDGISTAAVSKMVKRLVEQHELIVQKDGRGRVTAVNLAHYDELRGKFADPSKLQALRLAESGGVSYDKALADKTTYDAERSRLRLAVETGELVKRDEVDLAMDDAGLRIARAIDQIGIATDVLAAAYERGGVQALRIKLRELARETREQVADILDAAAAAAPEAAPA